MILPLCSKVVHELAKYINTLVRALIMWFCRGHGTPPHYCSTAPAVLGSGLLLAVRTAVDDVMASLSTTQLGFQRTIGVSDTYIPGTVLEHLYKRQTEAHESDDDVAFILTLDVFEPTVLEIWALQDEVEDDALTKAIKVVKSTVRSSGRLWFDSKKVQANKALE